MHPLAIANSQLRPGTDLQRAWSSPSRVNRSRLAQANSRNAAVPTVPITPFLLPGEARNCQLPSSSNQNTISRYSPFFTLADNPDIPSSWLTGAFRASNRARFMIFTQSFGARAHPGLEWSVDEAVRRPLLVDSSGPQRYWS